MIGSPMDLFLMMLGVFLFPAYLIMLGASGTLRNSLRERSNNFGFAYYIFDLLHMLGLWLVVIFIFFIKLIRPRKYEIT